MCIANSFSIPSLDEQTSLAEHYGLSTLLFCPDIWALRHRFINQETGEVMRARCNSWTCLYCGPRKVDQWRQLVKAAEPTLFLTLTRAGYTVEECARALTTFLQYLRRGSKGRGPHHIGAREAYPAEYFGGLERHRNFEEIGFHWHLQSIEREKERLKLKRTRILKQHRDGYIDDVELQSEMAAVELALRALEVPEMNGLRLDDIVAAGERLPGIAALWEVATPEERRDMVLLMLEPEGLYYDLELKEIAAVRPRPAFLSVMRLIEGFIEYKEATGTLVMSQWQRRNRRVPSTLSATRILFREPSGILLLKLKQVIEAVSITPAPLPKRRPGPTKPRYAIPRSDWPDVVRRIEQGETLRQVAGSYNTSYETVRRVLFQSRLRS